MTPNRRDFIRKAALGASALATGDALEPILDRRRPPAVSRNRPDVVVIGAGAFGGWTALHLSIMGADVTVIDAWGPGNSRSTSGAETRGVRTGYGDKRLWVRWAKEAVERWKAWDAEWAEVWDQHLFSTTSDLIMREEWEDFLLETRASWEAVGVRHEVLDHDEMAYRWPQIRLDGITVGLHEIDAGVVRARAACHTVAETFRRHGGRFVIGRAEPGRRDGGRLADVVLGNGDRAAAEQFVFACGPWLGKVFPQIMGPRLRIPLGHTYYYATPPGDHRFTHPHLPSYNFPGVTGWPALSHDSRGFRIRTGGRPSDDPDTSDRWIDSEYFEQPRDVLRQRFPDLADAPLIETRACHYELSVSRNWIIDRHPDLLNVWIAGGGSAEGFKFGPVLGPYIAGRVLGNDPHPELAGELRIPDETFQPMAPRG